MVAAQAPGYETVLVDSCFMDAAGRFPVLFAAERPPDLVIALRATCERCLRAPAIQARAQAGQGRVRAVPQADVDRPEPVAKPKPLHLRRQ